MAHVWSDRPSVAPSEQRCLSDGGQPAGGAGRPGRRRWRRSVGLLHSVISESDQSLVGEARAGSPGHGGQGRRK